MTVAWEQQRPSLICIFVILAGCIRAELAVCKILIYYLVSVTDKAAG